MCKMRDEFEAWVVTCRFFKKLNAHLKQNSDGSYGCYAVNDRWMAWQAARQPQEYGDAVAYVITDSDGVRIARLAEHVEPNRLIAVDVQPLYAHPTHTGRVAEIREQRIRAGMAEASLEARTRHLHSCEIALSERDARIAALESQLADSNRLRDEEYGRLNAAVDKWAKRTHAAEEQLAESEKAREGLKGALKRIGSYPRLPTDELGYSGCRQVANAALAAEKGN